MRSRNEQESKRRDEEASSRLAWFLTGVIVGAAAAVLYTPRSGSDTRRFLAGISRKSRDAVAGTGKDVVEAGREMYERGRRAMDEAADIYERGRKLVRGC
jgi:gas vesicle protein